MVTFKNIHSALFLFLFLFSSLSLLGNGGIRIVDANHGGDDPPADVPFLLPLNGCDMNLELYLWIANLDSHPNPFSGESDHDNDEKEDLPSGSVYLNIITENFNQSFPIDWSNAQYFSHKNGEPIFFLKFGVEIDIESGCTELESEILVEYSLRTFEGTLYPIHSFSEPGGLFSCNVFLETCSSTCGGPCNPNINSPEWQTTFDVNCCTCKTYFQCTEAQDSDVDNNNSDTETPRRSSPTSQIETAPYSIAPNPFSSDFVLKSTLKQSSPVQVNVFNAKGSMVFQSQETLNNRSEINISGSDWPAGIYYLRISGASGIETLKLIKIN